MLDRHDNFHLTPPVQFEAWMRSRAALELAVAAGPGLVALVAPQGFGKSLLLEAFFHSHPKVAFRPRLPGWAPEIDHSGDTSVMIDLIDQVDIDALDLFGIEPAFDGVRVVGIRPDALKILRKEQPKIRVVAMPAMSRADIILMINSRYECYDLRSDIFTTAALSSLERICRGNPGVLDDLLRRLLPNVHSTLVYAEDVEEAACEMSDIRGPTFIHPAGQRWVEWQSGNDPDETWLSSENVPHTRQSDLVTVHAQRDFVGHGPRAQDLPQQSASNSRRMRRALACGVFFSLTAVAFVTLKMPLPSLRQEPKRIQIEATGAPREVEAKPTVASQIEIALTPQSSDTPSTASGGLINQFEPSQFGAVQLPKIEEGIARAPLGSSANTDAPEFVLPANPPSSFAVQAPSDAADTGLSAATPVQAAEPSSTQDLSAADGADSTELGAKRQLSGNAEAARLLALGNALAIIGQTIDAGELFKASAAMDNRQADPSNNGQRAKTVGAPIE
jgi:hypothetical protein